MGLRNTLVDALFEGNRPTAEASILAGLLGHRSSSLDARRPRRSTAIQPRWLR